MKNTPDIYHVELVWEYYHDTEQRSDDNTFYLIAKNGGIHQWCQKFNRRISAKDLAIRGIPLVDCKVIVKRVKNLPKKKRKVATNMIWSVIDE
jgi:hypothetical protein